MSSTMGRGAPRILALFGARVIFGQELANMAVLAALQRTGCHVLCVIRPEKWPELIELRGALEAHGLAWTTAPYIDVPIRGWWLKVMLGNPGAYLAGNVALRRIARDFGATHVHAFNPTYVAAFWSALRSLDLPMIYRAGDEPVLHNAIYRAIWRFLKKRVTVFVANSRWVRDRLIAAGAGPENIPVIYSPPFKPETGQQEWREPGAEESFRFVYVGQITEDKGVGLLVEAFRRLAPQYARARLVIAGPIGDWSAAAWACNLRDIVLGHPTLRERVTFLGKVDDGPAVMAGCDVHVAPRLSPEPYGNVAVEAKSVGRPSIIFNRGGIAELVEDGEDGTIVTDVSPEGLANAMEAYLIDPGRASRQGAAARASITRFGFDRFGDTWREIYDRVSS